VVAALAAAPVFAAEAPPQEAQKGAVKLSPNDTLAYVGTFTKGQAKGIYVFRLLT